MAKTELHPDQMYIEGLANNNSAVIQSIYKKSSKVVSILGTILVMKIRLKM
jgi:hypothetical protein